MTDGEIQLIRVFAEQAQRALDTAARLFDQAAVWMLTEADATTASRSRWVRPRLPGPAPRLM